MKVLVLVIITFLLGFISSAQIISTIAGNGNAGYSGDAGLAINAILRTPNHLAYDQSGNLFIAEDYNHVVRKIDAAGVITTVAGNGSQGFSGDGGLAVNAQLNRVTGVTIDDLGNIYICDGDNFRIRKVDVSGNISTIVGTGSEGYTGDGGLAVNAEIGFVTGICIDNSGNIYIANQTYHNVRKVNSAGIISTVAGDGTGNPGYGGESVLASSVLVDAPSSVFIDATGNLFFSEFGGHRIRKVNTSGIMTTVAGNGNFGSTGDGGPAINAKIYHPYGLVVNASGEIFFCESINNKIRKVNASGIISTFAGVGGLIPGYSGDNGPAIQAKFANPSALIFDNSNNLFIGDYGNNVIRKIEAGTSNITEVKDNFKLNISPNPFLDKTVLNFGEYQEGITINIINEIGDNIRSVHFSGEVYVIEKNELAKGIYFIQIIKENDIISNKKVILQ